MRTTIIRVERNIAIVDKAPLDDPRLSFRAKGLYAYLSSHEEGASISQLFQCSTDSPKLVRAALRELKAAGNLL